MNESEEAKTPVSSTANDRDKLRIRILKLIAAVAVLVAVYFVAINNAASIALNNFDFDRAITLIKCGASIDSRNTSGDTGLALTCESSDYTDFARWFIAHGADVNARTDSGDTPLMSLAGSDGIGCADLLLRAGADINLKGQDGSTALSSACFRGNVKLVDLLLSHGANIDAPGLEGQTLLTSAIENQMQMPDHQMAAIVRLLLAHGARLDQPRGPITVFDTLYEPEVSAVLLDHGAKINALNSSGETPIQAAARQGAADVIPVLVAHGANPNAANPDGQTPLAVARYVWSDATVVDYRATYQALLKAGANPRTPSAPVSSPGGTWPGAPPAPPTR